MKTSLYCATLILPHCYSESQDLVLSVSMTLSGLVICCIVVNYDRKLLKFGSCLCTYLTETSVRTDYHFSEAILIGVDEE